MRKIGNIWLAGLWLFSFVIGPRAGAVWAGPGDELRVLCYHDVPKEVAMDNFGVDQASFVNTIEYLRTHGFHFVSLEDVRQARAGAKDLPEKPVLLTFDDGYLSYSDFVKPLLEEYKIPSVLSVVTSWIDTPPEGLKQPLMTWDQLREVSRSPFVEIASHSDDLHHGVVYNPQGNEDAAVSFKYDAPSGDYETQDAYQRRIQEDIAKSKKILEDRLGIKVRTVTWPYGKYNAVAVAAAKDLGMDVDLALNDEPARAKSWPVLHRYLIYKNPELSYLLRFLKIKPDAPDQSRTVQVDLDLIYDEDPDQVEENLGILLDRIKDMKVSRVYLQAFADPDGTGNIAAVYFPNKVLPARADLFSRVVHQLRTRAGVEVYAWMPMLSLVLPDPQETEGLRVRVFDPEASYPSPDPYQRLSPFSPQTVEKLVELYSDMAKRAPIDGVLFQDDGYLSAREDFHPEAVKKYLQITGDQMKDPDDLTREEARAWTQVKIEQLVGLTRQLQQAVRVYRPDARFARNLYAEVLMDPSTQTFWAQDYANALEEYDEVVIMAYSFLERPEGLKQGWFKKLVETANGHSTGLEKTVFKIQTFDWQTSRWIKSATLNHWLESLVGAGARHIGYYPDDYTVDEPRADVIRRMMSTEDFPFKRKLTEQDWMYNP